MQHFRLRLSLLLFIRHLNCSNTNTMSAADDAKLRRRYEMLQEQSDYMYSKLLSSDAKDEFDHYLRFRASQRWSPLIDRQNAFSEISNDWREQNLNNIVKSESNSTNCINNNITNNVCFPALGAVYSNISNKNNSNGLKIEPNYYNNNSDNNHNTSISSTDRNFRLESYQIFDPNAIKPSTDMNNNNNNNNNNNSDDKMPALENEKENENEMKQNQTEMEQS